MSEATQKIKQALHNQQYIATDEIATVVYLAEELEKPILLEGPAGVGKTELSKAWAATMGRPLIRLQCYEGLDETKALYEWEYAKQMLYTQLLRDKLSEILAAAGSLSEAADKLANEEDVFFSERFLLARPLLQAITADEPVVLVDDREAAHLVARHELQGVREVLVRANRDEIPARDLAHRHSLRVFAVRDRPDHDVAIRDDAGQRLAVEDRERADVLARHQLRSLRDRGLRRHAARRS